MAQPIAPSIECLNCNSVNPPDARYCHKCGRGLLRTCLKCGKENVLGALHCISCGSSFNEVKQYLTDVRVLEWWGHFCKFDGFAWMWDVKKGYAQTQYLPVAQKMFSESDAPRDATGINALNIPIRPDHWCIQKVQLGATAITYGTVWADSTYLHVFDFNLRKILTFPYHDLAKVSRLADLLTVTLTDGRPLSFLLRVPRPSALSAVTTFMFGMKNSATGDWIVNDLAEDHNTRVLRERREKFEVADNYVGSIENFFIEVIHRVSEVGKLLI